MNFVTRMVVNRSLMNALAAAALLLPACGGDIIDPARPTPLVYFAHVDREEGAFEAAPRAVYWGWNEEHEHAGELITEQRILSGTAFDWFDPTCAPFVYGAMFERVKRSVYFDLIAEMPLRTPADAAEVRAAAETYDFGDWLEAPSGEYWVMNLREMTERGLNALSAEERARIPEGVMEAMAAVGFAVFAPEAIDAEGKAGELLRYLRDQGEIALRAAVELKRPECIVDTPVP